MRGTTPKGADVAAWIGGVNEFWVAKGNPELTDFNYAAETYDAVIVIALAAAAAGTDGIAHAAEIDGITGGGEKCTDVRRLHGDHRGRRRHRLRRHLRSARLQRQRRAARR